MRVRPVQQQPMQRPMPPQQVIMMPPRRSDDGLDIDGFANQLLKFKMKMAMFGQVDHMLNGTASGGGGLFGLGGTSAQPTALLDQVSGVMDSQRLGDDVVAFREIATKLQTLELPAGASPDDGIKFVLGLRDQL